MGCKCGHGSKWAVCADCVCVKRKVACGSDCHCASAGVTCVNPFNPPPSAPPPSAAQLSYASQQLTSPTQQSQALHYPAPLVQHHGSLVAVSSAGPSSADRLQEDLRHDFERLVMLMTASRDSLAFGTENQGVYAEMHRMMFSGVDKLLQAGRHPISGWQMLQCNEGSQQLQHMLGTLLHKAELRTLGLENPQAMQWRVHPDVQEAMLRDFFVRLHERVRPT